jgi:hypothetical protein
MAAADGWRLTGFAAIAIGCAALPLASCEAGMHARLDHFGRVTRSTSSEFCIKTDGRLKGEQLCARKGASQWQQFSKGECVHLYVLDPDGEAQTIRSSAQCGSN